MNVPPLTPEQRAYVAHMEALQDRERYGDTGTAGMLPGSTDFPQDPRGGPPPRPSPVVAAPARTVAGAPRMDPLEEIRSQLYRQYGIQPGGPAPADAPAGPGMAPSGPPRAPQATTLPAGPSEPPTGPQSAPMRIEVNGVGNPPGPTNDEILRQGLQGGRGFIGNFLEAVPGRAAELVGRGVAAGNDLLKGPPGISEAARRFGNWRPTGHDRDSLGAKAGSFAADMVVGGKAAEAVGAGVQSVGMGIGATGLPMADKAWRAMEAAGNAIRSFGGHSGLPKGAADLATRAGGGAVAGATQAAVSDPDNIGLSAGLGAAVPVAGAVGSAVGRGFADVARPFTQTGRQQLAGQVFRNAAQDPNALANMVPRQTLGGQNVAEATLDPGLARLVAQLRADPRIGKEIAAFEQLQNAQRSGPLMQRFTGANDPKVLADARRAATKPLYDAIDPADLAAPLSTRGTKQVVQNIAKTPRFQTEAVNKEVYNAVTDRVGNRTIQRIQDPVNQLWRPEVPANRMWGMRQNIDQRLYGGQATKAQQTAKEAKSELDRIRAALSRQLATVPGFKAAEQTYASMSKPIEAAEVFRDLGMAVTTGTFDKFGNPMLAAAKYTNTLKAMQKNPEQWSKLDASEKQFILDLGRELADSATALAMGTGKGMSATNQLKQGQQQILPNLVNSAARSVPGGGLLSQRFGTLMERNQNAIMDLVGAGALDPATAQRLAAQLPREVLTPSLFGQLNRGVTNVPSLLPR